MKRSKNKTFFVFLVLLVGILSTVSSQLVTHFAEEISISIGGNLFNLENAFKNGKFYGDYDLANIVSPQRDIFGHQNDEIYLNVNGTFKNLKSAIEDGSLKCAPIGNSPAEYEPIIHGEYAKNVWINRYQMNLQTAINQGKFYAGDEYCNKKETEVNEYYVCSDCANVSHSDNSFYLKAEYSKTEEPIQIRELWYCWYKNGKLRFGENYCDRHPSQRSTNPIPYHFKWTPSEPKEGFNYVGHKLLGHHKNSETKKAINACRAERNADKDCVPN
jgi:hypothetical protein